MLWGKNEWWRWTSETVQNIGGGGVVVVVVVMYHHALLEDMKDERRGRERHV